MRSKKACRSEFQYEVGQLIRKRFPYDSIIEELYVPGSIQILYVDFFLPSRMLAFEIQGQQHFKYIPHFHKNKQGFQNSLVRDEVKKNWCQMNDITLYTIASIDEAREILNDRNN